MKIEQEIYNKLISRDESGLTLLYDNYIGSLYGMAFRILQDEAHAEDVIQNSFLKIWNNIGQFDSNKSTLFTWMAIIVKNTAIDTSRLVSFQKEKTSESFDIDVHIVGSLEIDESKIDALNMIEGLDEKYAVIIDYLYLRGYTQKELARELNIPIGTIKTRVKKAIEILRHIYNEGKILMITILLVIMIIA